MPEDNPFKNGLLSARRIGFDLPTLVLVVSAIGGAWWHLSTKIDDVSQRIAGLEHRARADEQALSRLNRRIIGRSKHGWHRFDMKAWCSRFEKANKRLTCPDPYQQPNPFEEVR